MVEHFINIDVHVERVVKSHSIDTHSIDKQGDSDPNQASTEEAVMTTKELVYTRPRSAPIGNAGSLLGKVIPNKHGVHSRIDPRLMFSATTYLETHADAIFSSAIYHVLDHASSVDEIPCILLKYFKASRDETAIANANTNANAKANDLAHVRKRGGVDRIVLATGIASIVANLIDLLLTNRPREDAVLGYLVRTLEEKDLPSVVKDERHHLNPIVCEIEKTRPKTLVVLVIGIGGSGKSTLVSVLKGSKDPTCKPSMGFRPITLNYNDHTKIKFYDIGGSQRIRGIWDNYYHDVHSVVFVIDSACSNEKFQESINVAKQALGHKYLQGKPLLVFSNKRDLPDSRSIETIGLEMNLNIKDGGITKVVETSLHPARANNNGEPDPILDNSMEWLIKCVIKNFHDLNERVVKDCEEIDTIRTKNQV